jgi:sugar phosphate isomerase/epimerase
MYSLCEYIKSDGLDAVLAAVKAAGFDCVETAGFYGLSYTEFGALLDKYNLYAAGAHTDIGEFLNNPGGVSEMTDVLNFRDVIIPWASGDVLQNGTDKLIAKIKQCADFCRKNGLRLGYHNHDGEFKGSDALAKLLEGVDGLFIEPDIFWMAVAGVDAYSYINKNISRVMAVHLKELSSKGKDDFNPVLGEGVSDTENILRLAKENNIPYVVLEFEKFDGDYKEFLKKNADYIKARI